MTETFLSRMYALRLRVVLGILTHSVSAVLFVALLLLFRFLFRKLHVPKKGMMALWAPFFLFLALPASLLPPLPGGHALSSLVPLELQFYNTGRDVRPDGGFSFSVRDSADGPTAVWLANPTGGEAGNSPADPPVEVTLDLADGVSIVVPVQAEPSPWASFSYRLAHSSRLTVFFWLWLVGVLVFAGIALVRSLRLRGRLSESVPLTTTLPLGDGGGDEGQRSFYALCRWRQRRAAFAPMMLSDAIVTPLVFGCFSPRIYLPAGLEEDVRPYAIAHERTHIRRLHPLGKLCAYVVTCLYWFHPLVILAFHLMSADMEMSCDEETVRDFGEEERRAYAEALLAISSGEGVRQRFFAVSPLGFEEGDVRARLKNLANGKKTAPLAAVFAVIVALFLASQFLTREPVAEAFAGDSTTGGNLLPNNTSPDTYDETTHIYADERVGNGTTSEQSTDYLPVESIAQEPVGELA